MERAGAVVIGYGESKAPDWRGERCDVCARRVFLPWRGAIELDDREDEGTTTLVSCVGCAMKSLGQQMVVAIVCGQHEAWAPDAA